MSDPNTDENTGDNTDEKTAEVEEGAGSKTPASTAVAPRGVLTRPTDLASRPGFRSPPNAKSKAQKNQKKGKK